jgi:hypothetical protein
MKRRQLIKALLATIVGAAGWTSTATAARRGRGRSRSRSPASPGSVAGHRRRVRRRTRRRIRRYMRLTSLPYGCNVTRIRGGITYYYCGNIWYQPVYEGTTVVYIVDEIEAGAETEVEFEEYEDE